LPHRAHDEELIISGSVLPHSAQQPEIAEIQLRPATSHSLVSKTDKLLSADRPPSWKRLVQPTPGCLNVCVSKEGRPRAMRLMSTLIATLEGAGAKVEAVTRAWQWSPAAQPRVVTAVTIENETLEIELTEPSQGKMQFELEYGLELPRRTWRDTPIRALEQQIVSFATAVFQAMPVVREKRLKEEAEERARADAQQLAEHRRRVAQLEQKRKALLRREVWRLGYADKIREYVQVIEESCEKLESIEPWLRWVREYAEAIDPRKARPDRFSDVVMPD
jgi:hypothetical protein